MANSDDWEFRLDGDSDDDYPELKGILEIKEMVSQSIIDWLDSVIDCSSGNSEELDTKSEISIDALSTALIHELVTLSVRKRDNNESEAGDIDNVCSVIKIKYLEYLKLRHSELN